jgi:hypothetical protein
LLISKSSSQEVAYRSIYVLALMHFTSIEENMKIRRISEFTVSRADKAMWLSLPHNYQPKLAPLCPT